MNEVTPGNIRCQLTRNVESPEATMIAAKQIDRILKGGSTILYVGIDYHKAYSFLTLVNKAGLTPTLQQPAA